MIFNELNEGFLIDKLKRVNFFSHLIQNKRYFFITTNNDMDHKCDIYSGIFVKLLLESDPTDDDNLIDVIVFNNIINLVNLKKLKGSWRFSEYKIKIYEINEYSKRDIELMEQTFLKKILRKITGDQTFSHYLFEKVTYNDENNNDMTIDEIRETMQITGNEKSNLNNAYIFNKLWLFKIIYFSIIHHLLWLYNYLRNFSFNYI
jgi:hypothetical protein